MLKKKKIKKRHNITHHCRYSCYSEQIKSTPRAGLFSLYFKRRGKPPDRLKSTVKLGALVFLLLILPFHRKA